MYGNLKKITSSFFSCNTPLLKKSFKIYYSFLKSDQNIHPSSMIYEYC
ncbi:hypothetical protein P689_122147 [Candidatus Riesia pediculischaeffi PTSU]|uniref:Uncharacterized protein n=1 Tax=Candidatus Riesia pediculischaeffi PTSU TaxID=1401651 RepID=A0A0C1V804_9ENTR|nr:hypothetical protein P689_122147 [Candidatus Riesia pediculischaeffi PTSU]